MTGLLVGLDVGSQSAKVVVHDAGGGVVAEGHVPLRRPLTPSPGVVEHPDDDLWDATVAACRAATDSLGERRREVVAVGLCGVRYCRALMRADGTLAAPVLSWMDERVSRPHDPADDPDGTVATVSESSGYLTTRLTGERRDSVACYRGRWPVDLAGWRWLGDADLPAYGLRRDQLMDLVMPGEVLGRVTDEAAAATGLPAGTPVVATANDKAVEALGAGLRTRGDLLLSLGTYVAAMTVGDRPWPESDTTWTNFAAVPGAYLYESNGVRRGMWTVSWLRDLLGATLADLEAAALLVPAGSDGLLTLLDWLPPVDQPWRRGAFVGLDVRHGPGHLYRSVLEALALTMQRHAGRMSEEVGIRPSRVLVSGGGAGSELLLQVVADAWGLPAQRAFAPSAAALGAALSAAVGVGLHPDVDTAVDAMVRLGRPVDPTPDGEAAYAPLRGRHEALAAALAPVLRDR